MSTDSIYLLYRPPAPHVFRNLILEQGRNENPPVQAPIRIIPLTPRRNAYLHEIYVERGR